CIQDSTVKQKFEIGTTIQNAIPPGCHFCELLTPYPPPPPPPREEGRRLSRLQGRYNYIHSATRMATECAFGRLKERFRLIRSQLEQNSIASCTKYILAATVLHNILIDIDDDTVSRNEQDAPNVMMFENEPNCR
ncbi:hypothetical protein JG687_00013627, partial [Phytophthora cactorum]